MANGNLLSTDEVLLLENLMYLQNKSPLSSVMNYENHTVAELINSIDTSRLNDSYDGGSYMNGTDWKNLIQAVKNNETLMNMQIATTYVDNADGGGGGVSAVFVNKQTGEAVVAFRGTAAHEWKDNFTGGGFTEAIDGVSTPQQENALDWYQSVYNDLGLEKYTVTITGHSKGGNKAKYITVMDGTVDRCVSFDGQGFSDEFIEQYSAEIAEHQGKIENHNVDYDYVNLLLNDIGNTTFYEGYDYGEGGFLENHCPNTFFNFNDDGSYTLQESIAGRPEEMAEMDEFLNSYLRSMSSEKKAEALDLVGRLVEGGFNNQDSEFFLDLLLEPENQEIAAYLIAYVIEYEQENPEFADAINEILKEFGMEDITKYIDIADGILNWEYFDTLVKALNDVSGVVPDWLWKKLSDWIYDKYKIRLTGEELMQLVGIINLVEYNMRNIDIKTDSGRDIRVKTRDFYSGTADFFADLSEISRNAQAIDAYREKIGSLLSEVDSVTNQVSFCNFLLKAKLNRIRSAMAREERACKNFATCLDDIVSTYEMTENKILEYVN